jgi:hypothetical protein
MWRFRRVLAQSRVGIRRGAERPPMLDHLFRRWVGASSHQEAREQIESRRKGVQVDPLMVRVEIHADHSQTVRRRGAHRLRQR